MPRTALAVALALASASAWGKPWRGLAPMVAKRDDVVRTFGKPTKVITAGGKEVLAYLDKEAIKGTKQAQFKCDSATQVLERIDVFPAPVIEASIVEKTYGPACTSPPPPTPCYVRKSTVDLQVYFQYSRLGLAVFFNTDGKTVQSLVFTEQK